MAVPLRMLLGAVPNHPNLVTRLLLDDDSFTIISTHENGQRSADTVSGS